MEVKKRFDKKYRKSKKKAGKKLAGIKKTIYLCPRNGTDTQETHSHSDYGMSHEKASEKRGGTPKRSLKEWDSQNRLTEERKNFRRVKKTKRERRTKETTKNNVRFEPKDKPKH